MVCTCCSLAPTVAPACTSLGAPSLPPSLWPSRRRRRPGLTPSVLIAGAKIEQLGSWGASRVRPTTPSGWRNVRCLEPTPSPNNAPRNLEFRAQKTPSRLGGEAPRSLAKARDASRDPAKPHEGVRSFARPREAPQSLACRVARGEGKHSSGATFVLVFRGRTCVGRLESASSHFRG